MVSNINPALPADGVPADKSSLRANLQAAKAEIEALQSGKTNLGHSHVPGDITGLGTAATLNVGTSASQIVQLDGSGRLPAVDGSQLTGISGGGGGSNAITNQSGVAGANVSNALNTLNSGLAEVNQDVTDLASLLGRAENATNIGTTPGSIVPDGSSFYGAITSLEAAIDAGGGGGGGTAVSDLNMANFDIVQVDEINGVSATRLNHISRVVRLTGTSSFTPLDFDAHSDALIILSSGSNQITWDNSPTRFQCLIWNKQGTAADVLGYTVPNGIMVLVAVDGADAFVSTDPGSSGPPTVTAADVAVTPTGGISSVNAQTALAELDAEKQPISTDLSAIAGLGTTGLVARTASGVAAARTLTGTSDQVTITNGNGVAGNPTIALVLASQAEAEAGTDPNKVMTALRTAQAIAELAGGPGGATLPVDDSTFLVQDPADNTKQARIDVGAAPTGTECTISVDGDIDLTEDAAVTGTPGQLLGVNLSSAPVFFSDKRIVSIRHAGQAGKHHFKMPFAGTITAAGGFTDTGTITMIVRIGISGTLVTGLSAVALDNTEASNDDTATAANTFSAGAIIEVEFASPASGPTQGAGWVYITQTGLPT